MSEPAGPGSTRRRGTVIAGAALVAAAVAAGALLVARRSPEPAAPPAPAPSAPAEPAAAVRIEIRTEPPEATLLIDRRPVENPFVRNGPPEHRFHFVTATLAGYAPAVQATAFDRDRRLVLKLAPLADGGAPPSPLRPGHRLGAPPFARPPR